MKFKRSCLIIVLICFFIIGVVGYIMADDVVPVAGNTIATIVSSEVEVSSPGSMTVIMAFLNSPLGVSIIIFILSYVLGRIFTAKPKWKALVLKYGPVIMQAVKTAEKNIPDDTSNVGLVRLDFALKYIIELEPKLAAVTQNDLKAAVSAVHATAEANENI